MRREPELVPILPKEICLERAFWMIVHEDLKNVAKIRAAISFIRGEVARERLAFLPEGGRLAEAGGPG